MNILENLAKSNGGFLANTRSTWADFYAIGNFDYCSFLIGRDILADYPNLRKVRERVVAVEGIKKYLEKRPVNRIPDYQINYQY